MNLKERIERDFITAMKAKDENAKAYSIDEYLQSPASQHDSNFDEWQGKSEDSLTVSYVLTTITGLAILAILIITAILKLIN